MAEKSGPVTVASNRRRLVGSGAHFCIVAALETVQCWLIAHEWAGELVADVVWDLADEMATISARDECHVKRDAQPAGVRR